MEKHLHYFGMNTARDTMLPESDRRCECGLLYSVYIKELRERYSKAAYGGLGGACNEFVKKGLGTREDFMRIILEIAAKEVELG